MKLRPRQDTKLRSPQLLDKAAELAKYIQSLSATELAKAMQISPVLGQKTAAQFADWSSDPNQQSCALDTFVGDMYSGLQVASFTAADRAYADTSLRILSGLYGVIRPLDGIMPYRLEMAYRLPSSTFGNLYNFWGDTVAKTLPSAGPIINASSVEYTRLVTPFVDQARIITPQFLTISQKTGEPTFVVVHAKIARGAFAHWLITQRIESVSSLPDFNELGYSYSAELSRRDAPAYVAREFGGLGLSVRLT